MPKLTKQQPQIHPYRYVLSNMARIELTEDGIVVSGVVEIDFGGKPGQIQDWWFIPHPLNIPPISSFVT